MTTPMTKPVTKVLFVGPTSPGEHHREAIAALLATERGEPVDPASLLLEHRTDAELLASPGFHADEVVLQAVHPTRQRRVRALVGPGAVLEPVRVHYRDHRGQQRTSFTGYVREHSVAPAVSASA